jgi:hypothetical protein
MNRGLVALLAAIPSLAEADSTARLEPSGACDLATVSSRSNELRVELIRTSLPPADTMISVRCRL